MDGRRQSVTFALAVLVILLAGLAWYDTRIGRDEVTAALAPAPSGAEAGPPIELVPPTVPGTVAATPPAAASGAAPTPEATALNPPNEAPAATGAPTAPATQETAAASPPAETTAPAAAAAQETAAANPPAETAAPAASAAPGAAATAPGNQMAMTNPSADVAPPAAAAPPAAMPAPPTGPSFDVVRVEPSGDTVLAGQATPGAQVEVLDGQSSIATTHADDQGDWVMTLDKPLAPGPHDLALRTTSKDQVVAALSDQRVTVSVPEPGSKDVLVVVNTPNAPSKVLEVPGSTQTAGGTQAAGSAQQVASAAPEAGAAPSAEAPATAPSVQAPAVQPPAAVTGNQSAATTVAPTATTAATAAPPAVTTAPGAGATVVASAPPPATGSEAPAATAAQAPTTGEGIAAAKEPPVASEPQVAVEAPVKTEPPIKTEPAIAPEAAPTTAPQVVASAPPAEAPSVQPPAPPPPPPPPTPQVAITAVEADTSGTLYIAGTVTTGQPIRVYLDDKPLGDATPSPSGTWLVQTQRDLPAGTYKVRVDQLDPTGNVIARSEVPFERDIEVAILKPVGTAAADQAGATLTGTMPEMQTVIIKRRDNLWRIARNEWGKGVRWSTIYQANTDQIRNPHWIYPGQVFVMPKGNVTWSD